MNQQHQALARKWRPKQFADVIGQEYVVRALSNALSQNYLHHAYLFTGARGVGKTTLARLLAKCLNCETGITAQPCDQCNHCQEIDAGRFADLIEVDAASRTKVEDTRELLDNVPYAPTKGRFKVYLIDEVHMLSGHSFNALLKTLEEPPAHVKFLLATTDPQRLPATILSRCLQFHLSLMPVDSINHHLQAILKKEHLDYEAGATLLLAKAAEGSMRDALSLLDQSIAYGNGKVIFSDVKTLLGTIDSETLYQIIQALVDQDANLLLENATRLAEQGIDFRHALADLLSLLHQIAVTQAAPNNPAADPAIRQFAQTISREDVQLYYQIGLLGQRDLTWAPTQRSGFEMTLLRMLAFTPELATQSPEAAFQALETTGAGKSPVTQQHTSNSAIQSPGPDSAANSWEGLLKQLQLDGATGILAQHCELKEMTDTQVKLAVHPKQKALLNQKHIERIREAFSKQLGKQLSVKIDIDPLVEKTPANLAKGRQQTQQQAAEQAIYSDPVVQQMIQTFDATVIKSSINATDETKL